MTTSEYRVRFGGEEVIIIEQTELYSDIYSNQQSWTSKVVDMDTMFPPEVPHASGIEFNYMTYGIPRPKRNLKYKRFMTYYKNTDAYYQSNRLKTPFYNLAQILNRFVCCK